MKISARTTWFWFAIAAISALTPERLSAQIFAQAVAPATTENADPGSVSFSTDRQLMLDLDRANKYIADERFADAVVMLETILRHPTDHFFKPDNEKNYYRSLKSEARRILGSLPEDGREQFELHFASTAERLLKEAIAQGDLTKLSETARVYFHTPSGFEATWLFGRSCLDHGQPIAAAMNFQLLLETPAARELYEPGLSPLLALAWWRGGQTDRALSVLQQLRERSPAGFRWNNELVAWHQPTDDAHQWVARLFGEHRNPAEAGVMSWGVFRGNAARNVRTNIGSPLLNPRWEVQLNDTNDAATSASQSQVERQLNTANRLGMPIFHPLAVSNTVLLQKQQQLLGIDFRTGKLKWMYPPVVSATNAPDPAKTMIAMWDGRSVPLKNFLTTAKLSSSSDEKQAYYVEESTAPMNLRANGAIFIGNGRGNAPQQIVTNVLSALNLQKEGYLRWQVGGPSGEADPRLAGAFFLGAPLPLHNQLYVLGELAAELNLFCLDADNGQLIWAQPLVRYEIPLSADLNRRITNLVPSYSDGVMVCPTNSGAVVAVDIFNRCLLWAQTYTQNQASQISGPFNRRMVMMNQQGNQETSNDRWADGAATITGNRVLLGPADGDDLLCLDLLTGETIYRMVRSDFPDRTPLYVASVDPAQALVVGRTKLYGVSLDKKQVLFDVDYAGGQPSGRGYRAGNNYYLPLNTAEVIKIDLTTRKIAARSKSRKGVIPGNLIVHQGQIVSVNQDRAQCFYSLDDRQEWVNATLKEQPNDAAALLALGEIQLNSGDLEAAATNLEKSLKAAPDEVTQSLLAEALLQSLKLDFTKNRERVPLLKQLIVSTAQKEELSRLLVERYLGNKEYGIAMDEVLSLCQLPPGQDLEEIEPGKISLRRDRWIQALLSKASKSADAKQWKTLTEKLRNDAEALLGKSDNASSKRLLTALGRLAISDDSRLEMAKKLVADKQWLDAELQFMSLEANTRENNPAAWIAHAEMLQKHQRWDELYLLTKAMQQESSPAVLETAKKFTALEQVAAISRGWQEWPAANIEKTTQNKALGNYRNPLEMHWDRLPFHRDTRLEFDNGNQDLIARDGQGTELYKINMNEIVRQQRFGFNANMSQARFVGHMLLINIGFYLAAYDTSVIEAGKPRQLWRFDVTNALGEDLNNIRYRQIRQPNGRFRMIPMDANNRPLCNIALASRDLVCLVRGTKLFALDSRTGEIVWIRHDVRASGEITGDERVICVFSEQNNEVVTYSAIDGREIANFKVPPEGQRIAIQGTRLLASETVNAKQQLKLIDLATGELTWSKEFAINARAAIVDQDTVAVFEQRGVLSILSLDKGELQFNSNINPEASVSEYQVLRNENRYLVVIGRSFGNKPNTYINGINNGSYASTPFTGYVYGIDAKNGKLQWERKVEEISMLHNQPSRSPAFVLGAMIVSQENNGNVHKQSTRVLALDKRTGDVVCDEKFANGGGLIMLSSDPAKQRVNIQTQTQLVQLTYTEKKTEEKKAEEKKKE